MVLAITSVSRQGYAQEHPEPSRLTYAVKGVLLDPTTYAPAILAFDATLRDWKTSQVFFENGFVEKNPRFTVTGLPYDQAMSYESGRTQILKDSLGILEVSAVQNFSDRLLEHALLERFPAHQRMVKAIGWVERASVATLMSYRFAGPHYQQWRQNQALAADLGFR
jgi:hypothetical protein